MSDIDFSPIPGREQPRFAGIKTFFRLPHVPVDAGYDVALAGLPYDGALSYRPGARFAPSKVRELSSMGRGYHMTREVNFVEKLKVGDVGDCPTVPIDMAQTGQRIEDFFGDILARDKKFICVGGDHSNTLPLLR
ncbi:MAG: arginase family protein, partial [Maricaulis sp.]|nr:arginase family protein [Maricaulis sp.]